MISPGMNSMTSVEKYHSRTHQDCIHSDVGASLCPKQHPGGCEAQHDPTIGTHNQQVNSGGFAWTRHATLAPTNVTYWI